jgi:hypothetical protein
LIALWDGASVRGRGGTADVVGWMLEGRTEGDASIPISLFEPADRSPVLHLHSRRPDAADVPREPPRLLLPATGESDEAASAQPIPIAPGKRLPRVRAFQLLDTLNLEIGSVPDPGPEPDLAELGEVPEAIRRLSARRQAVDELGIRYKRQRLAALRYLTALGGVAVASLFAFGALRPKESVDHPDLYFGFLFVYLALGAVSIGVFYLLQGVPLRDRRITRAMAEGLGFERKHLDYRATAEGLRVQTAWLIAGVQARVSDSLLLKLVSDSGWIRNALGVSHLENGDPPLTATREERVRWTLEHWIHAQERYFAQARSRDERRLRVLRRVAGTLFGLAIACSLATLVDHWDRELLGHKVRDAWSTVLLTADVLFLSAAAVAHYFDRALLEENVRQFTWGEHLYRDQRLRVEECLRPGSLDLDLATRIIEDLGKAAMLESSLWLMFHRARPTQGIRLG